MKDNFENNGGNLLMIFVKNREEGKVKTRLAKDIGEKKALEIYDVLLEHTKDVAMGLNNFRMVLYSDYIDFDDVFPNQYFLKDEQARGDLGDRLSTAFEENFNDKFDQIVCIGSDCYELDSGIIKEAFKTLDNNEVVLGPAKDGGYYLIGMKQMWPSLFQNKEWSTSNVLLDTLLDINELNLTYKLLPTLSDVDVLDDLSPNLKALI